MIRKNYFYLGGPTKPSTPQFVDPRNDMNGINQMTTGIIGQGLNMAVPGVGTAYTALSSAYNAWGDSISGGINANTGQFEKGVGNYASGQATARLFQPAEKVKFVSDIWDDDNLSKKEKTGVALQEMLDYSAIGGITRRLGLGRKGTLKHTEGIQKENITKVNTANQQFVNDQIAQLGLNKPAQMAAMGGDLSQSNDSSFREFNNGSTHENNPLGGVPVSLDGEGNPNTVEEGETMKDTFVFSDRLTLDNPEQFDLSGSYKNKTFADISKSLNKFTEERPNDPIAKSTFNDMTDRLKEANDFTKQNRTPEQLQESLQYKSGGKMYAEGGLINEGEYDLGDMDLDMEEIEYLKRLGYNTEII